MATTTDETTINDLADAYTVLDPAATREDHLSLLQLFATDLGITTNPTSALTEDQATALTERMDQV